MKGGNIHVDTGGEESNLELINIMSAEITLCPFNHKKPIHFMLDASPKGIVALIYQEEPHANIGTLQDYNNNPQLKQPEPQTRQPSPPVQRPIQPHVNA